MCHRKENIADINKISVLMSLYYKEKPKYLSLCLDSLVKQTRKADEVVIIIDGEIGDDLKNILGEYSNLLPIKAIYLSDNVGLGAALNIGLLHCSGELIARMDTDDISTDNRLMIQEKYILSKELDIIGTGAYVIDLNGDITGFRINPKEHSEIVKNLWKNPFIHPSVMFKKSKVEAIGAYNCSLKRRQDYELWFRAAKKGLKFGNVEEKLIKYRFGQHTLEKQSIKLAFNQGVIGFRGSVSCQLGLVKAIVCFVPFFRSLFPISLQIRITKLIKFIDSRSR